jgi:flagellar M-ring protein FliF
MGAVAAGLVGFFAFLILRLTAPQMTLLFTDLDVRDSNAIIRDLESNNIPFELRADGSTILVPKEEVLRLRMRLAEDGLPVGGNMGYEIFDKSGSLGTSSYVQNINHLRALEGELARTVRTLDRVSAARVHLVLPERKLFSREANEPSAAIVLKTRGELDASNIRAIQNLAASAVNGLKPSRVSIVDETGRLLASGRGDEAEGAFTSSLEERRLAMEKHMHDEVMKIVSSVVGDGRARVNVVAELDYNRITQTSDTFDPDSRVVRSTQLREEKSLSRDGEGNTGVSVGNELPGTDVTAVDGGSRQQADTTEEVVNYEISRTTKTETMEAGRLRRLSVAVLVDGTYVTDSNGNLTYSPRSQEQIEQIASLVRSAVGYDESRGDQVEIVNLRFADIARPDALGGEDEGLALTRSDYFYMAELAVLVIVAVLVLLFVVRPLVRRIITPETGGSLLAAPGAQGQGNEAKAQIAAPEATAGALPKPDGGRTSEMIDVAQFNGQIHASSVQKVGELIQQNPEEAVAIVRQWLGDAA